MNKTANAILWVGLFLIAMIVVAHWAEIRKIIFTNPSAKGSTGGVAGALKGVQHIIQPGIPFTPIP